MRLASFHALALSTALACAPAATMARDLPVAPAAQVGLSPDRLARIDQKIATSIATHRIPGAVMLVMRDGKVVHYTVQGDSDVASGRKMRKDDIFRLYSMTKPIVSVALLILYEEGKFQLDDPLEKYLPEFKDLKVYKGMDGKGGMILEDAKRKPTVQDAMRHTSGLTNAGIRGPVEQCYLKQGITFTKLESLTQEMKLISGCPLAYQPGERWLYAKNHDVQAYLVEKLSGMPLDQFLQQRLFGPLGMVDTGYGVPASKKGRIAQYDGPIAWPDPQNPGLDMRPETYERFATRPFGTEGLWSTATDVARLSQMLLNGGELDGVRIVGRKTVEMMATNQLPAAIGDLRAAGNPGIGYGLGFSVAVDPAAASNLVSPGTFGWTGAATTSFMIDPKERLVAVFMAQKWPYDSPLLSEIQTLVYQALVDAPAR